MGRVSIICSFLGELLRKRGLSEDADGMDEDVPMDEDPQPPKDESDLAQYDLDNYDEDDAMPGAVLQDTNSYTC